MNLGCERLAFLSLLLLTAGLPFSIAAVGIFSVTAVVCFLLSRLGKAGAALQLPFRDPLTESMALAYVLACLVSAVGSQYPALSFMAVLTKSMKVVLLFIIVQATVTTPSRVRWFVGTFFLAAIALCVDGFWQLITGTDFLGHQLDYGRIGASMKHPNDLGGYLVYVTLPLGVVAIQACRSYVNGRAPAALGRAVLGMLAAFAALASMGLTYSRGSWAALMAAMALFLVFQPRFWKPLLLTAALFLSVFTGLMLQHRVDPLVREVNATENVGVLFNSDGRDAFWKDAVRIFQDNPLIGTGLNTYTLVIKTYDQKRALYAHNCFLQMGAETGILGLGTFLMFVACVMITSIRRIKVMVSGDLRAILYAFLASWAGIMVHAFFDTTFYSTRHWALIWLLAGFLIAAPAALRKNDA